MTRMIVSLIMCSPSHRTYSLPQSDTRRVACMCKPPWASATGLKTQLMKLNLSLLRLAGRILGKRLALLTAPREADLHQRRCHKRIKAQSQEQVFSHSLCCEQICALRLEPSCANLCRDVHPWLAFRCDAVIGRYHSGLDRSCCALSAGWLDQEWGTLAHPTFRHGRVRYLRVLACRRLYGEVEKAQQTFQHGISVQCSCCPHPCGAAQSTPPKRQQPLYR